MQTSTTHFDSAVDSQTRDGHGNQQWYYDAYDSGVVRCRVAFRSCNCGRQTQIMYCTTAVAKLECAKCYFASRGVTRGAVHLHPQDGEKIMRNSRGKFVSAPPAQQASAPPGGARVNFYRAAWNADAV